MFNLDSGYCGGGTSKQQEPTKALKGTTDAITLLNKSCKWLNERTYYKQTNQQQKKQTDK
jgi:hypothetical protein